MINIHTNLLDILDANETFFMLHLTKRVDRNMTCFPSIDTLVKDTRFSRKKVFEVKKRLLEKGILKQRSRSLKGGLQTSNIYYINTDYLSVFVSAKGSSFEVENKGCQNEHLGGVKNDMAGVSKPTHEVLSNEVLKHIKKEKTLKTPNLKIQDQDPTINATNFKTYFFGDEGEFYRDGVKNNPIIQKKELSDERLTDEIYKFFNHNASNLMIMQAEPTNSQLKNKFRSWLSGDFCKSKKELAKKNGFKKTLNAKGVIISHESKNEVRALKIIKYNENDFLSIMNNCTEDEKVEYRRLYKLKGKEYVYSLLKSNQNEAA